MSYVAVGGVQTWYAEHGTGDPLLLLHGGFTDASEFGATAPSLAEHFHVFTPERCGHGHTPDVPGPISYDLMAADTAAFLDQLKIGRSRLPHQGPRPHLHASPEGLTSISTSRSLTSIR